MKRFISGMLCAVALLGTASSLTADPAPGYTLVTIPTVHGSTASPMAVNDDQQVVFTKITVTTIPPATLVYSGYVWDPENGTRSIRVPGDSVRNFARVFDTNENGTVVGTWTHRIDDNISIPFRWDAAANGAREIFPGAFELPELVRTLAMNDRGHVVGTVSDTHLTDARDRYGFYWDGVTDPLTIPEFRRATDLNNLGQIVGQSSETDTALLRNANGTFLDLGALPGDSESIAYDINELGVVVGASGGVSDSTAFLWSNGTMISLDPTGMFDWSAAYSINDLGQVVGAGVLPTGPTTGFLWEDGTLWELNDLADSSGCGVLNLNCRALDINNRGDIVGDRVTGNFLLVRDPSLPGDYNGDGNVDAADYVVWRKNDGSPAGYSTWRENFGASLSANSGAAGYPLGASAQPLPASIPEPASVALLLCAVAYLVVTVRRSLD